MKSIARPVWLFLLSFALLTSAHAQKSGWEYNTLRNLADNRSDSKNTFYKNISKLNNPVCLASPATMFITGLIKHDNTLKKKALYVTESLAASQALTWALKLTVSRERPFVNDPTFIPVVYAKNKSFPSGHAAESFANATALTIACPKWYVIVPAYGWATLVSYSRLYLGVHYPTDILGGAIVGGGSAWLMYKLNKWMHSSKKDKEKIKALPN